MSLCGGVLLKTAVLARHSIHTFGLTGKVVARFLCKTTFKMRSIGTSRGLLWTREWNFGFRKMPGISWLAEELLAFQEGLCSLELGQPRTWIQKTPPKRSASDLKMESACLLISAYKTPWWHKSEGDLTVHRYSLELLVRKLPCLEGISRNLI
jgi:hypothetical protein